MKTLKMCFLLNMGILFHCYVSLPKGRLLAPRNQHFHFWHILGRPKTQHVMALIALPKQWPMMGIHEAATWPMDPMAAMFREFQWPQTKKVEGDQTIFHFIPICGFPFFSNSFFEQTYTIWSFVIWWTRPKALVSWFLPSYHWFPIHRVIGSICGAKISP